MKGSALVVVGILFLIALAATIVVVVTRGDKTPVPVMPSALVLRSPPRVKFDPYVVVHEFVNTDEERENRRSSPLSLPG